jgi:hypothetical protein
MVVDSSFGYDVIGAKLRNREFSKFDPSATGTRQGCFYRGVCLRKRQLEKAGKDAGKNRSPHTEYKD